MEFTVILPSHASYDLSYRLVFIPCPVWIQGTRQVINLNPERPDYQLGSVRKLLKKEKISPCNQETDSKCIVIVHEEGYATSKDLNTLKEDLQNENFIVDVFSLSSKKLFVKK